MEGNAKVLAFGRHIAKNKERWRKQDADQSRRAIRQVAADTGYAYDKTKNIIDELRSDGGYDEAVETLCTAMWRLKQAEVLLERAKGLVK